MTEQEAFEAVGRKQLALDTLNTEYDRLLVVLGKVVSGEIDQRKVTVDLAMRCWGIEVDGLTPATPDAEGLGEGGDVTPRGGRAGTTAPA